MVKEARKLKLEDGILFEPPTKCERKITNDTVEIIKKYYENEEIFRILPGKKDFVSIKVDNHCVLKQKRLLLMNLNELYANFCGHEVFAVRVARASEAL